MANQSELVWLFCALLLCASGWIVLHLQSCLRAISHIDELSEAAAEISERLDGYEKLTREAEKRSFEQSLRTGLNPTNLLFDVRRKMNAVRDLLNEIEGALESEDDYAIALASDALDTLRLQSTEESVSSHWESQLRKLIDKVSEEIDSREVAARSKVNEAA